MFLAIPRKKSSFPTVPKLCVTVNSLLSRSMLACFLGGKSPPANLCSMDVSTAACSLLKNKLRLLRKSCTSRSLGDGAKLQCCCWSLASHRVFSGDNSTLVAETWRYVVGHEHHDDRRLVRATSQDNIFQLSKYFNSTLIQGPIFFDWNRRIETRRIVQIQKVKGKALW